MIDIDDIKKFLQDYALKTLLPYLEKQISQLSEVVSIKTCFRAYALRRRNAKIGVTLHFTSK